MSILHSYRWRRRLIITAITAGIAGPLIYLGVHFSNPGNPGNATGPEIPDYVQPKHAPFTKSKQRAVRRVLKQFISTAVVRHDVARSWSLAGPDLRQGVTRREWNRGDIPVVPYPAASRGLGDWSYVEYSYTKSVGLEVFVFPKPGSGYSAMSADVEVVKGHDGRWRVNYWMPKKFHGPAAVAPKATGKAKAKAKKLEQRHAATKHQRATRKAAPAVEEGPRAKGAWWALPVGLLSMAVLLPVTVGLLVWYRNRKAWRDYIRSAGR